MSDDCVIETAVLEVERGSGGLHNPLSQNFRSHKNKQKTP